MCGLVGLYSALTSIDLFALEMDGLAGSEELQGCDGLTLRRMLETAVGNGANQFWLEQKVAEAG